MKRAAGRLPLLVAFSAAAALALTACVPGSSVTPAVFPDEQAAFAAAERTYRAYVDALNDVDVADRDSWDQVFVYTRGDQQTTDRLGFNQYYTEGLSVTGDTVIALLQPSTWSESRGVATLAVCVDISGVDLLDADGRSIVPPERTTVQSLDVTLLSADDSPTDFLITSITPREGSPECAH